MALTVSGFCVIYPPLVIFGDGVSVSVLVFVWDCLLVFVVWVFFVLGLFLLRSVDRLFLFTSFKDWLSHVEMYV
jgi:hypothetical protein